MADVEGQGTPGKLVWTEILVHCVVEVCPGFSPLAQRERQREEKEREREMRGREGGREGG